MNILANITIVVIAAFMLWSMCIIQEQKALLSDKETLILYLNWEAEQLSEVMYIAIESNREAEVRDIMKSVNPYWGNVRGLQ